LSSITGLVEQQVVSANLLPLICPGTTPGENCQANQGQLLLTTFDGLTATRNRWLGSWLRPAFYAVVNGRFAANMESLSLVSSGGTEGSPPAEWSLVQGTVFVGESNNNPGRFGPCPVTCTPPPGLATPGCGAIVSGGGSSGCIGDARGPA